MFNVPSNIRGNQWFILQESLWGRGSSEEEEEGWLSGSERNRRRDRLYKPPVPSEARALWESRDDDGPANTEELLTSRMPPHPQQPPQPSPATLLFPVLQLQDHFRSIEQGPHREKHSIVTLYCNVQAAGDVMSNGAFMPTLFSICALL
ncbi:hypothetical protein NQZ68_030878 [Dissostichus eleginoides]|nr:hypothetical protein NQZ68_030878 [Dissostichus eleginoides]